LTVRTITGAPNDDTPWAMASANRFVLPLRL